MVSSLLVNEMYVEDGSMVGSLAQLREVVDIILWYGLVRGLHLSMVNSKDWNLRAAILDPLEHYDLLNGRGQMIMEWNRVLLS